jgi:hypothetical protein
MEAAEEAFYARAATRQSRPATRKAPVRRTVGGTMAIQSSPRKMAKTER